MRENITTLPRPNKFVSGINKVSAAAQNAALSDAKILRNTAVNPPYFSPQTAERKFFYDAFKRSIDINLSLLIVVAAAPLIGLIAVIVKLTSPGPVLFKHRRIGKNGKEFDCWKFRTMVCNADEILHKNPELKKEFEAKFKIDNDPRITPIGKFLRSSSLDELPQLVQVLQGRMSLIGPRPVIARELEKYAIYREKLLSVKPGLSGLWQTSGRSDTTYAERVLLDMTYIDKRSALLDTKLIFKTAITVVKRSGAC